MFSHAYLPVGVEAFPTLSKVPPFGEETREVMGRKRQGMTLIGASPDLFHIHREAEMVTGPDAVDRLVEDLPAARQA